MLRRLADGWNVFEEGLSAMLMISSTLILFVNVVLRYLFHNSTTWAEEVIRYSIIWVTFVGGSVCAKQGEHIGIELFTTLLPPKANKALRVFANLIAAVFVAIFAVYAFKLTMQVIQLNQRSPAIYMPMWIVYSSMPLGGFLMAARFLELAYKTWKGSEEAGDKDPDLLKL